MESNRGCYMIDVALHCDALLCSDVRPCDVMCWPRPIDRVHILFMQLPA